MRDRYWFDNSLADEGGRLRLLEAIADPRSIRLLVELGVAPGWRCAELGAGGGSIALWLSDRVGDRGSVIAVDQNVALLRHLDMRKNVAVVQAPLEELELVDATLDLIHTRNVLMHVDNADQIIETLVNALRPGGVLLMEEADYFPLAGMTSRALFEVASPLVAKWTWARTIPNTVARLPVEDVAVTLDTSMLQGGSPEAAFWTHTFRSVEHRLTDPEAAASNGLQPLAQQTFEDAMDLLADDSFWTPFAAVVCVSCRRRPSPDAASHDDP